MPRKIIYTGEQNPVSVIHTAYIGGKLHPTNDRATSSSPRKANSCTPTISASFGVGHFAWIIFQMPVEGNANDRRTTPWRSQKCERVSGNATDQDIYSAKPQGLMRSITTAGSTWIGQIFLIASAASVGTKTAPAARVSHKTHLANMVVPSIGARSQDRTECQSNKQASAISDVRK